LAAETAEEKEAILEGQRAAQQERLAAETAEEKEARLEGQKVDQQKSLAAETCLCSMSISRPDLQCVLFV